MLLRPSATARTCIKYQGTLMCFQGPCWSRNSLSNNQNHTPVMVLQPSSMKAFA
jgi:hypothetical protein